MLKIDRAKKCFEGLEKPTLSEASISERYDLQAFICNSPNEFFSQFGEKLFLIGEEITPSETVQDRIDILSLDREGNAVIVELKRASHKLHLLQAISYAGMISKWQAADFVSEFNDDKTEELADFLNVDIDDINRQQRIILVAEAFDYALLIGAEWLTENFGVSITCCRIEVETDPSTKAEYMSCSSIYPNPELAQQATTRAGRKGRGKSIKQKWTDWDTALEPVENSAITEFFQAQLDARRENYLPKRMLLFRVNEKRRVDLTANNKVAYGWQHGRFTGDIETWKNVLSKPKNVEEVNKGKSLRFFLHDKSDFDQFEKVVAVTLPNVQWRKGPLPDDSTPADGIDENGDAE